MSKLKCDDCGTIFEGTMGSCPTCGCPVDNCVVVEESSTKSENIIDDGRESYQNYYYVDFDWFKSFSSDPRVLTFLTNVKFLKWLCAPWHIQETNNTLSHVIANDIFFLINRFWKLLVYDGVWALCKALPIIIVNIIGAFLITDSFRYQEWISVVMIPAQIAVLWFLLIGFGKSCKRYGIPFVSALRHLYITVSKDIKDNLK